MPNEIKKFITNTLPAEIPIQQKADKIYNIEKAANINVTHVYTSNPSIDLGLATLDDRLNTNYYHLIVLGNDFDSIIVTIPKDRALSSHYTDEIIRNKFVELTQENISELLKYPVLITTECSDYYAKADNEQIAYVGKIEKIRTEPQGIKLKLKLELSKPILLQKICSLGFELNLLNMDIAITELNHSHWALKPVNLIQELSDAGIDIKGSIF